MAIPGCFTPSDQSQVRKRLESTHKPILVYFMGRDSNLGKLIQPVLEEVCSRIQGSFELLAVDLQENKDLSYEWRVMRTPSFILFRNGEEVRRMGNVSYHDDFASVFEEFLLGDFLFADDEFEHLDQEDFFPSVEQGFQTHLVAFLKPAHPANVRLADVLSGMRRQHPNLLRVSLVNTRNNPHLLEHFKLDEFPAVLSFQDGEKVREWAPIVEPATWQPQLEALLP